MATHSSILAWRIPWTEEPGGLQSMGSQREGHDWSNLARTVINCIFGCAGSLLLCTGFLSSCGERGLLFVAVHGLLTVVASRCRVQALGVQASITVAHGLSV